MAALSTPPPRGRFATAAFRDLAPMRRPTFSCLSMTEPHPLRERTPTANRRLLSPGVIVLCLAVLAASVLTAAALIAAG